MIYNPYNISDGSVQYNPYRTDSTATTAYNVPTYNANNTNG